MDNMKKYNMVYFKVFGIKENEINEDLNVLNVENWDSVAQMNMASMLEELFDIILDPEDLIDLVSYTNGKTVLEKHGIKF